MKDLDPIPVNKVLKSDNEFSTTVCPECGRLYGGRVLVQHLEATHGVKPRSNDVISLDRHPGHARRDFTKSENGKYAPVIRGDTMEGDDEFVKAYEAASTVLKGLQLAAYNMMAERSTEGALVQSIKGKTSTIKQHRAEIGVAGDSNYLFLERMT
jgi:hypothetical protein